MATTTTNNGWDIPQSSDYVKLGADAIAELGQDIDTSVGTGLLAWTTWAPTLSGGWLNGNGVWDANYAQLGKTVFVNGLFTLGTTTTRGTILQVSLPVTAKDTVGVIASGTMSVGGSTFVASVLIQSTTTVRFYAHNSANPYASVSTITTTIPGTWAATDLFRFQLVYEAA